MKRLKHYIEKSFLTKESLLDDEDKVASYDENMVKDYIENHYEVKGNLKINKKKNNIFIVDCDNVVLNKDETRLTNGLFRWGKVDWFECDESNITSLEGAPQKCDTFRCSRCNSLKTLEGAPKICHFFNCFNCQKLISLEGAPKKCKEFDCKACLELESLKGAPEKCKDFWCRWCPKLETLEGAPQKCYERFYCTYCTNLKSLKGAPQKCGDFTCDNCPKLETLEEAPKDCGSISYAGCKNLKSLK